MAGGWKDGWLAGWTGQSVGYLEQRDAKAAVAAARRHGPKDAEIGLLGASMGGAVALIIGHGEDVGAVGVATDCAFARLSDVLESRVCATLRFPQPLAAFTVDLASRLNPLLHGYSFKSVSPVDAVEHGPRAGQVPLLLIHADNDEVVTVSQAHAIHSAALAPKELVVVQHCHHVGCFFKDRARYLKLVADFFDSAFAAAERRRIGEGREVLPTPERPQAISLPNDPAPVRRAVQAEAECPCRVRRNSDSLPATALAKQAAHAPQERKEAS
eukprot:s6164_g2.t1